MNPEFQRQLWLQFSPTRLVLMPVLLTLCFGVAFLSAHAHPLAAVVAVAAALFVLLTCGMGTLAVGHSVADEFVDHTWDQQRMSAMTPWAMAWGKLVGAASYGWYGGALCLAVALPCALLTPVLAPLQVLQWTLLGALAAVFMQASVLAVNLQMPTLGGRLNKHGGALAALAVALWLVSALAALFGQGPLRWWGWVFSPLGFGLGSAVLFAFCALVAAWRSMAEQLAVRQAGWGWPALALVLALYLAGLLPPTWPTPLATTGLGVCMAMTYLALLTEPQTRPLWHRVLNRMAQGRWRTVWQETPRWVSTLVLAVPFALGSAGPATWTPWQADVPAVLVLLLARDGLLALFFAFSPHRRRQVLGFVVLMGLLYGLLPWLLTAMAAPGLRGAVLPLAAPATLSLVYALVQLGVAGALLRWRWRQTASLAPGQRD